MKHVLILTGMPLKWENEIPRLFQVYLKKKKFQPSGIYVYWRQSMQNEIKNTIETNSTVIC